MPATVHCLNANAQSCLPVSLGHQSSQLGGWKRPECHAWAKGRCTKGDGCQYSHEPIAMPVQQSGHILTSDSGRKRNHFSSGQLSSDRVQNPVCAFVIRGPSGHSPHKPGGLPFSQHNGPDFIGAIRTMEIPQTPIARSIVDMKQEDRLPTQPIVPSDAHTRHAKSFPLQAPSVVTDKTVHSAKKPCFDFRDGMCRRGDKCLYSHDPNVISATAEDIVKTPPINGGYEVRIPGAKADTRIKHGPSVPLQPCYDWILGRCERSFCRYFHDPEIRPIRKMEACKNRSKTETKDIVKNIVSSMPPTGAVGLAGSDDSSRNREDTPQASNEPDPIKVAQPMQHTEICQNFLHGKCHNLRCHRIHPTQGPKMRQDIAIPLPSKGVHTQISHGYRVSIPRSGMKFTKEPSVGSTPSTAPVSPVTSLAPTVISASSSEPSVTANRPRVSSAAHRPHGQVPQKTAPCLSWKDGRCFRGDGCFYEHDPEVQKAESARKAKLAEEEASKTVERLVLGSTRVTFGAGSSIQQMITGFESCRVLVKNLSLDAVKSDVENLLTRPGFNPDQFRLIVLRKSADGIHQEASVIFYNAEDGRTAAAELDGTKFEDEDLRIEVTSAGRPGQMGEYGRQRQISELNVSFKAPSRRALAIYPSKQIAKEKAETLDNDYCGGRQVRVALNQQPPGRPLRHFIPNAVVINSLAVDVSSEEIHRFSECFSLKLFPPKHFDVSDALRLLQTHMTAIGNLKATDFEVLETPHYKGNVAIRAHFETWKQAKKVMDSLANKELDYLCGGRLNLILPYPFQYSLFIPIPQYEAQKTVFTALVADHAGDDAAHIIASRLDYVYFLRVVGTEKKAVGSLKVRIERLAAGERINYWDRFFLTKDGSEFLQWLFETTSVFVCPDPRLSVLKAFGEPEAVEGARKKIKRQLDRLASMEFGINLKIQSIRFFVRKGVQILKEMVGEDNVHFDISSVPCRITVRGGEDARHALRRLVDESLSSPIRHPGSDPLNQCPLCLDDPINPFPLACGHLYCNGCMQHLLTSAINGKQVPLRCIGDEGNCKSPIPIPVMERFLPPAPFNRLLENCFRTYIDQNPQQFRYCPTPDCAQIYRVAKSPTFLQCPSCFAELCSHCHSESHEGVTCAEWARNRDPEEQERLLRRWAKGNSNVKRCPDCRIFIEKVDGCNHIRCLCGSHVCWICRKSYNDGIYEHLGQVHGGAFDIMGDH